MDDSLLIKYVRKETNEEETRKVETWASEKPENRKALEDLYYKTLPLSDFDGKDIVMHVKCGDNVIMSKYSGTEVKIDGVDYIIVRQSDILAIVE